MVQENAGELFVNPDSSTTLLNDRPPLRFDAVIADTPPPAGRYSYVFGGNAQSLDHRVVNAALISSKSSRLSHARGAPIAK